MILFRSSNPITCATNMGVMNVCLLFVMAVSAVTCHGYSFRLRRCPKVKVMREFEMDKFVGEWFVVGRYHPLSTCIKLNVEKKEDGNFTVNQSAKSFGILHRLRERNSRKTRMMRILSNKTEAIFRVEEKYTSFGPETFGIIDTDYTNYAIVWGCDTFLIGTVRNLDILSRTANVKDDFIEEAAEKAKKAGINAHPLETVRQERCNDEDSEASKIDSINNMYVKE